MEEKERHEEKGTLLCTPWNLQYKKEREKEHLGPKKNTTKKREKKKRVSTALESVVENAGKKALLAPKRPSEKKKHRFGIHSRKARREKNLARTTPRKDDQKKPVSSSSLRSTSARNVAAEKKATEMKVEYAVL